MSKDRCSPLRLTLAVSFVFSWHCIGLQAQQTVSETADQIDFKSSVAKILSDHCVECHNPAIEMAGLRLDHHASVVESGVIDPGDSESSLLIQRLRDKDLGITMPPGGKLSDADVETLKRWIEQGAKWPEDVSLYAVDGTSKEDPVAHSLFIAIRSGKTGSVKRILERSPNSVALTDPFGSTPLHQAAWLGNVPTLKHLLSQGGDVNAVNRIGVTPLMLAIGNDKKTELLLASGADVNARSNGRTPLMLAAAKSNNSAVLKRLISAGADVNAKDNRDWTPLILAARTGDVKMLELLLDAGAELQEQANVGLSPGTPLTQAAWAGDLASVRLLLARDPHKQQKSLDLSLIVAATHGYEEIVRALVEAGADANANVFTGYIPDTPLQAAAYSDHRSLEVVRYLIDHGAAPDVVGRRGETAAGYASTHGHSEIAALFAKLAQQAPVPQEAQTVETIEATSIDRETAIEKSFALIQSCDLPFFSASGCVACHHHSTTSLAASIASDQGFPVDPAIAAQRQKLLAFELKKQIPAFMQRHKSGGTAHRIGYLCWSLAASKYAPDTITDGAVYELSGLQLKNGSWVSDAHRPPTEYSPFSATAVSVRAMQDFTPPGLEKQFEQQIKRARKWLESATPRENQEFAFRLLGLRWTNASQEMIDTACDQLLGLQNDDGGWAQLPQLPSDAYATGLTLYALHIAGDLPTESAAYEKGVAFLLRTQDNQGAWHVKTRSYAFQPYFESGFPYEQDQWISSAATGWASSALLLSAPRNSLPSEAEQPAVHDDANEREHGQNPRND